MTAAHSVMTTEGPPMARGTPWLPVSFLLWLSLSPWIQNHPFFSLSFSVGSRPQFLTCLADTHTHTHRDNNKKTVFRDICTHRRANITLTKIKACMYIYIHSHAHWSTVVVSVRCVYKYICVCIFGRGDYSMHPPTDFFWNVCVTKGGGWLVGVGVNQLSTNQLVTAAVPQWTSSLGKESSSCAEIPLTSTLLVSEFHALQSNRQASVNFHQTNWFWFSLYFIAA